MANDSLTITPLISSESDSGDGVFTPVTSAISTNSWESMKLRWSFVNNGDLTPGCETRPGVQYSDDGVTWDAPVPVVSAWKATNYPTFVSAGLLTLPPAATYERLLLRLGFFTRRTTSSGGTVPLMPSMTWEAEPTGLQVRQVVLPATTVATKQDTDGMFLPMTEAIQIGNWTQVRTTLEVLQLNSGCELAVGYWLSDDGVHWGTYSDLGVWTPNQFKVVDGTDYVDTTGLHYSQDDVVSPTTGWATVEVPDVPKTFLQLGFLARDSGTPDRVNFGRLAAMVQLR